MKLIYFLLTVILKKRCNLFSVSENVNLVAVHEAVPGRGFFSLPEVGGQGDRVLRMPWGPWVQAAPGGQMLLYCRYLSNLKGVRR